MNAFQETRGPYFEVKYVVDGPSGIEMHLVGHDYPYKGNPSVQAVHATNTVKKILLSCPVGWSRLSEHVLSPFLLESRQLTAFSRELEHVLSSIGLRSARIIAHVFEYDAAYRFRVQDLLTESSKDALLSNPQKEIGRLLAINKDRDYAEVSRKFKRASMVLRLALYIPPIRAKWNKALRSCNFSNLQFDDNDRYWASLKTDYEYFGKKRVS